MVPVHVQCDNARAEPWYNWFITFSFMHIIYIGIYFMLNVWNSGYCYKSQIRLAYRTWKFYPQPLHLILDQFSTIFSCMLFVRHYIFPKYLDTLTILTILVLNLNKYNLLPNVVSKIAGWVANSVDPDEMLQNAASHLGLHSLLRPVPPNTNCKKKLSCSARAGICNKLCAKSVLSWIKKNDSNF